MEKSCSLQNVYRTGDLVKYGAEGKILILGRRDTQVKLHGQRIELGEIGQSLLKCSLAITSLW